MNQSTKRNDADRMAKAARSRSRGRTDVRVERSSTETVGIFSPLDRGSMDSRGSIDGFCRRTRKRNRNNNGNTPNKIQTAKHEVLVSGKQGVHGGVVVSLQLCSSGCAAKKRRGVGGVAEKNPPCHNAQQHAGRCFVFVVTGWWDYNTSTFSNRIAGRTERPVTGLLPAVGVIFGVNFILNFMFERDSFP